MNTHLDCIRAVYTPTRDRLQDCVEKIREATRQVGGTFGIKDPPLVLAALVDLYQALLEAAISENVPLEEGFCIAHQAKLQGVEPDFVNVVHTTCEYVSIPTLALAPTQKQRLNEFVRGLLREDPTEISGGANENRD